MNLKVLGGKVNPDSEWCTCEDQEKGKKKGIFQKLKLIKEHEEEYVLWSVIH